MTEKEEITSTESKVGILLIQKAPRHPNGGSYDNNPGGIRKRNVKEGHMRGWGICVIRDENVRDETEW